VKGVIPALLSMEEGGIIQVEGDDEIFIYMGGEQVVPLDVRRVRIDKSVKIIPERAFEHRRNLIYVEFHDGIEIIEEWAFHGCRSLRSIKLLGVKFIEKKAFYDCIGLTDVEFGGRLETIEYQAFNWCTSLRSGTIPSVRTIGYRAFNNCKQLTDLVLPEELETVGQSAFCDCPSLRRIAMPLKDDMLEYGVFFDCPKLSTVSLVGGIHKTVSSLHLESWRNDMRQEINRINQVLPSHPSGKTAAIQQWMRSVIRRLSHYKEEHKSSLKEATTLLELALWKASLDERKRESLKVKAGGGNVDIQSERNESRITSVASIVIKNVLPYLQLESEID
jgi:hypothetical protein